ncbi:hypothetical protein F5148DRAFT_1200906 [Russula earlei]|uniref:Uncharacterized protein n=1 Tax=Russula earlei TaxID=71964 RepID=A0ACC0U858_9AGAM|nr:hypothetical protein F5148DRAFT_1200906 [Russula earlei]
MSRSSRCKPLPRYFFMRAIAYLFARVTGLRWLGCGRTVLLACDNPDTQACLDGTLRISRVGLCCRIKIQTRAFLRVFGRQNQNLPSGIWKIFSLFNSLDSKRDSELQDTARRSRCD